MTDHVAFDLARLFIGPMSPTPRGIDRVDLAYARHFFEEWQGDSVGVLPTPWGIRWFNRDRSLRVVNFIEDYWRETGDADSDPAYARAKACLQGKEPSTLPPQVRGPASRLASGFVAFARKHGLVLGRPISTLPAGAVYLNTGQITLAAPRLLTWLGSRQDVKPVFMLHDAIPLEYPEYCSPRLSRSHGHMLANTAHYAAGLIVPTEAAGESIRRELASRQRTDLPMLAAPLPVPPLFLEPTAPDPALGGIAYFVASGAIDPRKNHLLLLNVWRELVRRNGPESPKLVLAGSRWRTSDAVADMLDRCDVIRGHVVEIAGLSTPGLRQLLAGARALLMPSFAEGFGIPIIEALAVGTPVIASDLPAHREAGGAHVRYLNPNDALGWLAEIQMHAAPAKARRATSRTSTSCLAWTWRDYFRRVEPFIFSVG